MSPSAVLAIAIGVAVAPPPPLPQGSDHFRLGMSRAQVDSAVAARGLTVISDGTAFLVCASDDPTIDYEQYSFFRAPHGTDFLWKVTVGYRLDASRDDFDAVRSELARRLGEPRSETAEGAGPPRPLDPRAAPTARRAIWADPLTTVLLGARWTDDPDRSANRMLVTWTDRRLQRQVEARRKRDGPAGK